MVVALYPAFKNETSLNDLTDNGSAVAALFGANGPLTTPTGWLNANLSLPRVPGADDRPFSVRTDGRDCRKEAVILR